MQDSDSYQNKTKTLKERLTRYRAVSHVSSIEKTFRAFSPGDRLILYVFAALFAASVFAVLAGANAAVSVNVPARGGSITEGVVGPARFINPLLALSGPDRDLTALVYSGLTRATPEGTLLPDLANHYEISEDGTVYTFTLRADATFHDGTPVTSDDVLFTIQRAQNPDIKSVLRADWDGVSVATPDEHTVVFTLPHAYAPFLENTTVGILPRHLWEDISPEEFPFDSLNVHPVGSGPYAIKNLDTNSTGAATRYNLSSFENFALGEPHIGKISILFYPNEEELIDAFESGRVDSIAGISPASVEKIARTDAHIVRVPLPRTFGIFFNQNKNTVLADIAVRAALSAGVNKEAIVNDVLKGYGAVLNGPVPPGVLGSVQPATPQTLIRASTEAATSTSEYTEEGIAILTRNDWTFSEESGVWQNDDEATLQITLATADEPALVATMEKVAEAWRALGVIVETHIYPLSELNTIILRPREYEAVIFGEVVGRTLDLFAFWHSSQRNDPGLNIALYTNTRADDLLAEARATTDKRDRDKLYEEFADVVAEDKPAIFLYAPEFIYIVSEDLGGIELGALTQPAERYLNVHEWYTDTEHVWDIFTDTSKE